MPAKLNNAVIAARFQEFNAQLHLESDRGSVIVAAALLDDALKEVLAAYMLPAVEGDDELLEGPHAPLGSFSARIDCAYRTGLIRMEVRKTLHLIRKIRNAFAHRSEMATFDSQSVRDRLRQIYALNSDMMSAMWNGIRESEEALRSTGVPSSTLESDGLVGLIGWRGVFDLLASTAAAGLIAVAEIVEPIQPLD